MAQQGACQVRLLQRRSRRQPCTAAMWEETVTRAPQASGLQASHVKRDLIGNIGDA